MHDKHHTTEERNEGKLSRSVLETSGTGDSLAEFNRSCQDAIQQNFIRVCNGRDTWVLEADIKGFFDNIAHESILKELVNFPGRNLIKEWLKAGYIFDGTYHPTEKGTPQGGVISPLLANIGLHGLETFIKSTNPKLGVVRYADDFIITARDKVCLEISKTQIQQWLSARGLELSAEKTLITSMAEVLNDR